MSAKPGLGLSATVEEIKSALIDLGFADTHDVPQAVAALRYFRLARTEPTSVTPAGPPFTFTHRRFQEYFATCIVLDAPDLVSVDALLRDGRWRETAVTVLQMHPPEQITALLAHAEKLLDRFMSSLPSLAAADNETTVARRPSLRFRWPPGAFHLLSVLDAGFATKVGKVPSAIGAKVGKVLSLASRDGVVVDRKWALDVAGPVPEDVLLSLLRVSFRTQSGWLRETAFRQIGRIKPLPRDISREVYFGWLTYSVSGRLRRELPAMRSQVANFDNAGSFTSVMRVLVLAPVADALIHLLAFAVV